MPQIVPAPTSAPTTASAFTPMTPEELRAFLNDDAADTCREFYAEAAEHNALVADYFDEASPPTKRQRGRGTNPAPTMKGTPAMTAQTLEAPDVTLETFTDADAPTDAPAHGDEAQEDTFTPDTADKVDWLLGKIADARARAARIRENAERMAKEEDAAADFLLFRYGPALQAFCRKETEGGRKKSLRLFHGVIGYRTRPAAVSVTDERAALQWARVNLPDAVTEKIDRTALAAALLASGEVVDGTQFTPAAEVFYVK